MEFDGTFLLNFTLESWLGNRGIHHSLIINKEGLILLFDWQLSSIWVYPSHHILAILRNSLWQLHSSLMILIVSVDITNRIRYMHCSNSGRFLLISLAWIFARLGALIMHISLLQSLLAKFYFNSYRNQVFLGSDILVWICPSHCAETKLMWLLRKCKWRQFCNQRKCLMAKFATNASGAT